MAKPLIENIKLCVYIFTHFVVHTNCKVCPNHTQNWIQNIRWIWIKIRLYFYPEYDENQKTNREKSMRFFFRSFKKNSLSRRTVKKRQFGKTLTLTKSSLNWILFVRPISKYSTNCNNNTSNNIDMDMSSHK